MQILLPFAARSFHDVDLRPRVPSLRPPLPPHVSQDRRPGPGRSVAAAAAPGRSPVRRTAVAQVSHHDLPLRRAAASGHGRSQAGRPRRDSRRVQADPHQASPASTSASTCPGSPTRMDRLAVIRSLVGSRGAARRLPVHARPHAAAAAGRRLAVARLGRVQAAGPGPPRRAAVRRPVAADEKQHLGRPSASPVSSGRPTPRSSPTPRAWAAWCSSASRPNTWATAAPCWPASTTCAATSTPTAACRERDPYTEQALEHPHLQQAGRGPRPGPGAGPHPRPLRPGRRRSRPATATPARC